MICKKEKLKDETPKKIVNPMHRFHEFSLIVTTSSAFEKRKIETSKKIGETNGGQDYGQDLT